MSTFLLISNSISGQPRHFKTHEIGRIRSDFDVWPAIRCARIRAFQRTSNQSNATLLKVCEAIFLKIGAKYVHKPPQDKKSWANNFFLKNLGKSWFEKSWEKNEHVKNLGKIKNLGKWGFEKSWEKNEQVEKSWEKNLGKVKKKLLAQLFLSWIFTTFSQTSPYCHQNVNRKNWSKYLIGFWTSLEL